MSLNEILMDIVNERHRQDEKWGEQTHPFTRLSANHHKLLADSWKDANDRVNQDPNQEITWDAIALEELHEAFAETDPVLIRREAIETAAVMVALVEDLDRQAVPQDPT